MKSEINFKQVIPVMFGFFIMGFIDVVGIASNYIKKDFGLTDTVSNLILMMVFVWFFLFSVPTGVIMDKIGRKKTVIISSLITAVALFIPTISYSLPAVLVTFTLLGIGNTILQVSLNPLLGDIVSDSRLASSLTFGQFIKAIASFSGPVLAGSIALYFGTWRYLLPLFGGLAVLSAVWLNSVSIRPRQKAGVKGSFKSSVQLLKDPVIFGLFLGIVMVVGIDVGMNVTIPKYLMLKGGLPLEKAGLGTSLYFASRTLGTVLGAILLTRIPVRRFYIISSILALCSLVLTLLVSSVIGILIGVFLIGLTVANIFPLIYSTAMFYKPDSRSEVSGLMMMGVVGGAVVPLFIGIVSDKFSLTAGMTVLGFCMVYLILNALRKSKLLVG